MPKFEVKTWISRESKQKNKKFQWVRGQFQIDILNMVGTIFRVRRVKDQDRF